MKQYSVYICHPSAREGGRNQSHLWLYSKFKDNLGHMMSCLKNKQANVSHLKENIAIITFQKYIKV